VIWSVQFPQYEVALNSEQLGEEAILNIPSAFHLFRRDWSGAHEIVKTRKDAFTTPGLMGWRAVTLANVTPAEAMTHFDEAADAFAADTEPADTEERMRRGGCWSGANQQLRAKYFRARARLIESIREPAGVKEFLGHAVDALVGTEAGVGYSTFGRVIFPNCRLRNPTWRAKTIPSRCHHGHSWSIPTTSGRVSRYFSP